jgi:hypothetical protein
MNHLEIPYDKLLQWRREESLPFFEQKLAGDAPPNLIIELRGKSYFAAVPSDRLVEYNEKLKPFANAPLRGKTVRSPEFSISDQATWKDGKPYIELGPAADKQWVIERSTIQISKDAVLPPGNKLIFHLMIPVNGVLTKVGGTDYTSFKAVRGAAQYIDYSGDAIDVFGFNYTRQSGDGLTIRDILLDGRLGMKLRIGLEAPDPVIADMATASLIFTESLILI